MFSVGIGIGACRGALVSVGCTCITLSMVMGCSASRTDVEVSSKTLSASDLIERCAQTYSTADSIRARGRLILRSGGDARTRLVTWDYASPGKTRLRVGERVAVIRDGEWYRYDPTRDAYHRHAGLGGDPIKTAVYFMTDGAPMPEIALPVRGSAALGGIDVTAWRLSGVKWVNQRPCYVLLHPYTADRSDLTLAIWVDQETCLLRGWALEAIGADVDDLPILSCEYDSIELNGTIAEDQFATGEDPFQTIARANLRRR